MLGRVLLVGFVACFAVRAALYHGITTVDRPGVVAANAGTYRQDGLLSLPLAAQRTVSIALGRHSPAYRVVSAAGGVRARNPAQHLGVRFTADGVSVSSGRARLGLALAGVGYGNRLRAIGPSPPRAAENRVFYAHGGGIREWYANGPVGLEQGFELASRPGAGR